MRSLLILSLTVAPMLSISGADPDWDALIKKAEAPAVSFRAKYLNALQTAKASAQKAGELEDVDLIVAEAKAFAAGGWPDGKSGSHRLRKMEATFIMHYLRLSPRVSAGLRAIAAKDASGAINARIKKRLEHWQAPYRHIRIAPTIIAYSWRTKGSLNARVSGINEPKKSAREILESSGVTFPEGASAIYDPRNSKLTVRNTIWNMVLIDAWLKEMKLR